MSDEWGPAPSRLKPDEPISYEHWQAREKRREITAARLALCARGVYPGANPLTQLAELEIIDIATGRGTVRARRCPIVEIQAFLSKAP